MKRKPYASKIILPILLLVGTFFVIEFRTIMTPKNPSTWYAPLTGITYHSEGSISSDDNIIFLLHTDGNFELSYENTTCHGHFNTAFPYGNKVLSPQRELYSFSFRTPCITHTDHSFYFTIYPNDLNSFTVSVETSSMDTEMIWLTSNNPAIITVSEPWCI